MKGFCLLKEPLLLNFGYGDFILNLISLFGSVFPLFRRGIGKVLQCPPRSPGVMVSLPLPPELWDTGVHYCTCFYAPRLMVFLLLLLLFLTKIPLLV